MGTPEQNNTQLDLAEIEGDLKKIFSVRVRRLREEAGQTQRQVAEALGFRSESVYQLWEKAEGNLPSATNLRKLALYFDVSLEYLLGMQAARQHHAAPAEAPTQDEQRVAESIVWRLALEGKDWDAPDMRLLLLSLRRSRLEDLKDCYQRVLTDKTYPPAPAALPDLSDFSTPAARAAKEQIERRFRQRPPGRARKVTLHVLDLRQVPSQRLQRILLGMQGAQLIKERRARFNLAISNGWMARNVILAPNLVRGDIEDVKVMPLALGKSQYDSTAATTLIGNFIFHHADYGISRLNLKDTRRLQRIAVDARSIDLAFMGIGTLETEEDTSLFARLLEEKQLSPAALQANGVIGNVLYRLIREDPSGPAWAVYPLPEQQRICVDIDDPAGEEELHVIGLDILRELVEIKEAQIVIVAKDASRARIVRAALEMRWANTLICTLALAEELLRLLA